MSYKLTIIIPVINEAEYIGKLLAYLTRNSSKENIAEIIVVDGGSTDESLEIIATFENVILLNSPKGRAKQLNIGGHAAKGDILYFLHADSFPPKDFDKKIIDEIKSNHTGSFRLKFEHPDHFLLKIAPWFTQFNARIFRGGDQSLFISKQQFEDLKGFDERYIIFEDIEFIQRICKQFHFKVIDDYVTTSERKFKQFGTWNLYYHFFMIHAKSWLGASPESLFKYYAKHLQD